jgi:hypothetical protein
MNCRRIIPAVCAIALAVPAAASAKPAPQPPTHSHPASADTTVGAYEQAISADTKGQLPRAIAPSAFATAGSPVTDDGAANGWQIAAVTEGGLLAAFAFGSFALVRGRRRTPLGA